MSSRRRSRLLTVVVVLIVANGIASSVGDDYGQDFSLPGSESTEGFDILDDAFEGQGAGQSGTIVFRAEQGVTDPEVQDAMSGLLGEVAALEGVRRVESPYGGRPDLISGDETVAYANVEFPEDVDFEMATDAREAILEAAPEIDGPPPAEAAAPRPWPGAGAA